jgi:hypothetical protein
MSTQPEQVNGLIAAVNALKAYFEGIRESIDAKVVEMRSKVDTFIAAAAANMPVTPNLLADAKHWNHMCGGALNVEQDITTAHGGPFSWFWYSGAEGHGTAKVVSLEQLGANGCERGGDLVKACSEKFYGSDFTVLVLDVTIDSDGHLFVINQGCPTATGWSKGETITQAAAFINVIEATGNIRFAVHSNMPASVTVNQDDVGKGWRYLHNTRMGFGGCHQPNFHSSSSGRMKVAIALPYIGYGNHQGKFIFANSVGRYSHGSDYLPPGRSY